jgi:hypothetical protein
MLSFPFECPEVSGISLLIGLLGWRLIKIFIFIEGHLLASQQGSLKRIRHSRVAFQALDSGKPLHRVV